ncbi:MAG: helix-turn-helix domain-containing protein [Proteobacteria bacterium]|nr:helix-turn-helix domain-containing protein [Pseudomonadota bacterium]
MNEKILTQWTTCTTAKPVVVWPDGCRDLIVKIEPEKHPQCFLTGLDKTAYKINAPSGTTFFGIRLVPGSMAFWEKDQPLSRENLFNLKCLGNRSSSVLHQVSTHPEQAPELLLDCVDTWFTPRKNVTKDFFATLSTPEDHPIIISKSARTFRRHICSETGAPPQFWMNLRRVRRAASDIAFSTLPLVEVALANGFSDQAHMTREIRRWLGQTPSHVRRNRDSYTFMLRSTDAFNLPIT